MIASVEIHNVKGKGSGVGVVGGALLDGLLGNQVGAKVVLNGTKLKLQTP